MDTSNSDGRIKALAFALATIAVACSSGGDSTGPAGTGTTTTGAGGAGGGGAGGGGTGTCEHVIVPHSEIGFGYEPQALAADSGQVYVLIDDGMGRTVRVAENGKLREVARAANESMIDLTPSNLLVDSSGYFFDVYQEGKKWLVGAPRAGGAAVRVAEFTSEREAVDPAFTGDASSLYLVGPEPSLYMAISRVPRMPAAAAMPVVVTDDGTFYNGLTAIAVAGTSVYSVSGSLMSYVARQYPKDPGMPVHSSKSASFTQSICSTFILPPHVYPGQDALYLGCNEDGGARAVIYRLPPADQWPADDMGGSTALGSPVVSGKVASDIFVVAGTTVYFADTDQEAIFKVSGAGGTPTRILGTETVDHMATDGTTLFVQGGCGIQSLPL
jgi:hypothetical protein